MKRETAEAGASTVVRDDDRRDRRVMSHRAGDRSEQQMLQNAVAAGADDEQIGCIARLAENETRITGPHGQLHRRMMVQAGEYRGDVVSEFGTRHGFSRAHRRRQWLADDRFVREGTNSDHAS